MSERYLLSATVLIWTLTEPERLSAKLRADLNDPESEVFISAASLMEIAYSHRLGRLQIAPSRIFRHMYPESKIQLLPVLPSHLLILASIPASEDRNWVTDVVLAQAIEENMVLVSEKKFPKKLGVRTRLFST